MAELKIHELCLLFPRMTDAELADLSADIAANGLAEPIVLLDGKILDGRNRYLACIGAGVEPRFETWQGDDPLSFVVSRNLHRRHLDASQRAMVAARLANLPKHLHKDVSVQNSDAHVCASAAPTVSQSDAAERLGVSRRAVQQARKVQEHGAPELVAAVDAGAVAVRDAAQVADRPAVEQRAAVAAVRDGRSSTVAKAAQPIEHQADFEKIRKVIGAAIRERDDIRRDVGDSQEAKAVGDLISALNQAVNVWRERCSMPSAAPTGLVLDKLKRAVPEKFVPIFSRVAVFDEIRVRLNAIREELDAICLGELGAFMHRQTVLADIDNLKSAIKFGRPFTVCPYCRGSGQYRKAACNACKTLGWVPEGIYKSAPGEMREAA